MKIRSRQRGVGLVTAIFLLVVIGALGSAAALTTVVQQAGSARALDAEGAYAAANGRLDIAIADAVNGAVCDDETGELHGYEYELECDEVGLTEGGAIIYELRVTASRGDRRSGTLVRRTVQAQVTDAN